MTLDIAIQKAQRYGNDLPTPPNEANTCKWVIEPLLLAAGYEHWEIISQGLDNSNSFPDYTILHQSDEYTWYLEAKRWNVPLEDKHAIQALNYANSNGKPWVILTNGQQWRLYDNRVQGIAKDKLVAEVSLVDSAAIHELLCTLRKESVTTGGIEAYVNRIKLEQERAKRQALLWKTLDQQLSEEGSPAVLALLDSTRKVIGLERITASEVVAYFNRDEPSTVLDTLIVPLIDLPAPTIPVFWQHFRELAKQLDFHTRSRSDPWLNTYYDVRQLDKPHNWVIFRFYVRPETAWAEILILEHDPAAAKSRFDAIYLKREELEQAFQSPLEWQYKQGLKIAKIRYRLPGAGINEVKNWPILHTTMIETMKRLMTVATPYLEALN